MAGLRAAGTARVSGALTSLRSRLNCMSCSRNPLITSLSSAAVPPPVAPSAAAPSLMSTGGCTCSKRFFVETDEVRPSHRWLSASAAVIRLRGSTTSSFATKSCAAADGAGGGGGVSGRAAAASCVAAVRGGRAGGRAGAVSSGSAANSRENEPWRPRRSDPSTAAGTCTSPP